MQFEHNFFKWLKSKYPKALIRVTSDCTVFYKIKSDRILPFYTCLSYNQKTGNHSKEFFEKCKELEINLENYNLRLDSTMEEMVKALNVDCSLYNHSKNPESIKSLEELLKILE